jgi:hypothetical protein
MSAPQQASAFNNQIPPRYVIKNITSSYTVTGEDYGVILLFTGFGSVTCTLAPSLGAGFNVTIWNNKTTGLLTVSPTSGTISGLTSITIIIGSGNEFIFEGTTWYIGTLRDNSGYAYSGATGVRANVTGSGAVALGYSTSAAAGYSSAIGANSSAAGSVTATGLGAMALGGSYASGTDSFAAGIANNSNSYGASGINAIAIGFNAKATGNYATAIGGYQSLASGLGSYVFGDGCTASALYSFALGKGVTSAIIGKMAFSGAGNSGVSNGIFQSGTLILQTSTTDATATALTSNAAAASSNNQVILPNNAAYTFSILVVARQSAAGGTASASWQITGLIRREGTAASTTLVASTVTTISNVPAWTIAVTADTTNGGLAVTATGAAATNIRWVATAQTSEVTYA